MCTEKELLTITSDVVSKVSAILHGKIYKIILYGSYARGDFTVDSDIDIIVILNCSKEDVISYRKQISKIASRVGLENDILVSILLRDKESFNECKETLPFYQNILREGVPLYE